VKVVLVRVLKKCCTNFWLKESIYDIKIKKDLEIMFRVKERRFVVCCFFCLQMYVMSNVVAREMTMKLMMHEKL